MKIFIDSANVKEIRTAWEWGAIDGVTTNPSLAMKEGRPFKEVAREILSIVDGPVSLEVVATEAPEMVTEGLDLASWGKNAVVKIPMTADGLKAIRILSGKGVRINTTLIFTPIQAMFAAKAGAAYVSPFIGRLDDIGQDGMQVIRDTVQIFNNYRFTTEVLVASVRHPVHVLEAAKIGAHVATVPFKVIEQLFKHPLTDIGLQRFLHDWARLQQGKA